MPDYGSMRHVRALAPYAAASLLVVVMTVAVLGASVRDSLVVGGRDLASASPRPSASRALPELSRSGRLAYWRTDPGATDGQLLVSNLDGTQRRAIARAENVPRLSLVRWVPDGSAVSWVESGQLLVIARLDGLRLEIPPVVEMRSSGARMTDVHWAPNGKAVTATVQRGDGKTDVWVASADVLQWSRATTLEDVYGSDWLAPDRLLVYTNGGVIATLRFERPDSLQPLTGLAATSPVLGPDGRIHFLAGRVVPGPRDPSVPFPSATSATAYSIAADGADLRKEIDADLDDMRLDAALGAGRYLVHRGTSPLQVVLGGDGKVSPLSTDAGPVQRAVASSDGKALYGLSPSRIVRFDVAAPRASPPVSTTPTVVIDSANAADVWFPRAATVAAGPSSDVTKPAARYAFWLGRNVWTMGSDGVASLLRPGPSARSFGRSQAAAPAWSPRGDRVLFLDVADTAIPGANSGTLVAYTVAVDGTVRPISGSRGASLSSAWAPDGSAFAVVVDPREVDGLTAQAELEARFFATDGTQVRAPIAAREVAWTRAGVMLLSADRIDLVSGDDRRTVVTRSTVLADPRVAAALPSASGATAAAPTGTLSSLSGSADGTYLGVRLFLSSAVRPSPGFLVTIRVSDGAVIEFVPSPAGPGFRDDLAWSPAGPLVGATVSAAPQPQTTEIRDVAAKTLVARQEGRFAGWSPDGSFYYVARSAGLYAYRPGERGSFGIWVSPIGVPVSTAKIG